MHAIIGKAVKAGAITLVAVGGVAFLVTALNRLWTEAAIFAGGTIPPLFFLWRHRRMPGSRRPW